MEHWSKIRSFLSSVLKKKKGGGGGRAWQHTTSLLLSFIQQTSQEIKRTR